MRIIFLKISLPIIISLFLFSCETKNSDAPNDVVYDSIVASKIYHLENDSTKPSCSVKIKYIFPAQYADAEVLLKIQKELNYKLFEDEMYEAMKPAEALTKYIDDYIANYKEEAKTHFPDWEESGDSEDYYSFYKTLDSRILFNQARLISYQVTSMDYKGGANSSTVYKNAVINLNTGDVVTEEDIFVAEYKKILNAMLTKKIIAQNKVQKAEDLLEFGYWGIEDISCNNNFYVDNNGLTYIFSQGEYSAPSLGEIRVAFTYAELSDLLKSGSPISILSGK